MKAMNLLPSDQRGAPKTAAKPAVTADEPSGIGAFVVLATLALSVVALAAYVLTTNTIKDREAQITAAQVEGAAVTARVAELKPYADFKAMAETRIQTVNDLTNSRFDWEQSLRDISRAIPADVTLASLNGTISEATGGGSPLRAAIASPAIELKGCTADQKAVATLLSRLRNVDGVTRVSLGKSGKPDPVAKQAGGGAAATADQRPPCGNGRRPEFELVIFFERSEVPESVDDITVQANAQATSAPAGGAATPAETAAAGAEAATTPADPDQSTPTSTTSDE